MAGALPRGGFRLQMNAMPPDVLNSPSARGLAQVPRIAHLETLRGIAACLVVIAHIHAAVWLTGGPEAFVRSALDTPLAIFTNGQGAVIFFFTLSGYVLALRALETGDPGMIVRGAIRRWPRLMGPVLVSIVFSYLLWNLGLYFHTAAAKITGSDWLAHFGYGILDLAVSPKMGFLAAVREGTYLTFITGEQKFNPALWTMRYEFYGGFAVYLAAFLTIRFRSVRARSVIFGVIFGVMAARNVFYVPFGVGLAMAVLRDVWRRRLPGPAAMLMAGFALYVFGYRDGSPTYAWFTVASPLSPLMTLLFTVASVAAIWGITAWPAASALLSRPAGRVLGSLSFPIYLVHLPVILSAGCAAFTATEGRWGPNAASGALTATAVVGIAGAASLLSLMDRRWVAFLNRVVRRLFRDA